MPTSLVTGAAGFIGSHVTRHLLADGHSVVALDDLSGGSPANLPADIDFIAAPVTDRVRIAELFDAAQFDYVFHLAAYAAEGLSHFIRRFNYTNNLLGSVTLINEAVKHDVKHFVFASSIAVYGAGQLPMAEAMTPRPEDPYGIAKYAVELDLEAARRMFGLDYTIFRPHNVYGEGQNLADRHRNVIGIFMNQLMRSEPLTIFGDGLQSRAFSYIDDVAPFIASAVDVPAARNEVFNVGGDVAITVLQLAHLVALHFGVEDPNIVHLDAREEVEHAYCSHEKVKAVFGDYEPVPLTDGIPLMAAWAKTIGPQQPLPFMGEIEVRRQLPPSWDRDLALDWEP